MTEVLETAGFVDVRFTDVHEPVYSGPDLDTASRLGAQLHVATASHIAELRWRGADGAAAGPERYRSRSSRRRRGQPRE